MATIYDLDTQKQEIDHLIGEVKDARSIILEYLANHTYHNFGKECHCHTCTQGRAFIARNNKH